MVRRSLGPPAISFSNKWHSFRYWKGRPNILKIKAMRNLVIAIASSALIFASCQSNDEKAAAIGDAKQATIDSMNAVSVAKQQVIDSVNAEKAEKAKHKSHSSQASNGGSYSNSNSADNATASAPAATTTTKKKGWSHTAKGAVVGAGAGAITGALVNKDHLKGAAIGTVIGAGVGAGTGAIVDHAKKKKAQQANQ